MNAAATHPVVRLRRCRWIAAALYGAAVTAQAVSYFADPKGDNAASGLSQETAWASIDRGQPAILLDDIAPGDGVIRLSKASQFPERGTLRIGEDLLVVYTGRTAQAVSGCQGVLAKPRGTRVVCPEAPPPQPGDRLVAAPGVYHERLQADPAAATVPFAVAMIRAGGVQDAPVIFEGLPGAILDGLDEIAAASIAAPHVVFEGFELRRGGIRLNRADAAVVRNCEVHGGSRSIGAHYCAGVKIIGNVVYDMVGAWSESGISLVSCTDSLLARNTVVANHGAGLSISRGSGNAVVSNLVAWCRAGIAFPDDARHRPQTVRIADNVLWACGRRWQWLQRDNDPEMQNYYVNVDAAQTNCDAQFDPVIVQWTPGKPDFLVPHVRSPIVDEGRPRAGARHWAAEFPDAGHRPGDNLVFNTSFTAGMLGWSDSPWRISKATDENGGLRIEVQDSDMKTKTFRNVIMSRHFRYTQGRALTLSFRARAEGKKTLLNARFTVPSWHGGSGVGKNFTLTPEWKVCTWTTRLPTRFPDFAAVAFSTRGGRYELADVKVEEGTAATTSPPQIDFLPDFLPGMLIEPGAPVRGSIHNRLGEPFRGELHWTLEAPFHGCVGHGEAPLSTSESRAPFAFRIPDMLDGGHFLCRYAFIDNSGEVRGQGLFRFSVGRAARPCRHQDFFAATPGYDWIVPGLDSERQYESLQAMGLGTLHLYLPCRRMNEMLAASEAVSKNLDVARRHGMQWLFTPSDAAALTTRDAWAPDPDNVGPEAIEFRRNDLTEGRCTEARLSAWGATIKQLVSTFKGRVKYWEVLNEPNTFLTGPEYAKVLETTAEAIRTNDPAAHIIAGSIVNASGGELYKATMAAKPGSFDTFSYHPYRFGLPNPEAGATFRERFIRTRQDLVTAGHKPNIFITEEGMGNAFDETRCINYVLSHSASVSRVDWGEGEIRQAQYMARMYAAALAEGGIGYNYHTLSSLLWDGLANPKLGLKAIHTMREMLGDAMPKAKIDVGRRHVAYLFDSDDARHIVVLWPKDAEYAEPTVRLLPGIRSASVRDLFGYPIPVESVDGGTTFHLGRELVYLTFPDASADAISRALRTACESTGTANPAHDAVKGRTTR